MSWHADHFKLVIIEKYRNNGYGAKCVEFIEGYVFEKGYKKMNIMTQNDNLIATKMYKKIGYKTTFHKKGIANNWDEVLNIIFEKLLTKANPTAH